MDFKTMRAFSFLLLCASQIFLLGLVGAAEGLKIDLIGIDIGTRYSCMGTGVGDDNDMVIIENDQGNRITPSMVSFTDTEILIGEAAKNQTSLNPEGTIFNFKRLIGRNFDDSEVQREIKFLPYKIINKDGKPYIEVKVNGQTKLFSPEDITALMLGKMKDMAELYLGKEITSAIVTIPAYFNDVQRKATEYAATKAGLKKTFLVHEPEAIAIAYGHPFKTFKANILIFDFEDSTFDVTIFALHRGNFEVLTATSTRYSDDINLLEILTNQELDVHLFNKTVEKALEDAGLKETDIDEIIIEGVSSTRLFPNVQPLLKNLFNGKEPIMSRFNPYEVVAFGAALVAADTNNPEPTLCSTSPNYNPLSLGIEIDGGVMMKVTPSNTIFPSNRSQTFTTCTDQQTIVSIKVYEGEGNMTKDCYELSRFYLTIPPAPRGVPQIEVTFLLDGYLRVIATDKATNNSESKNFYLSLNEQEFAESLEDFDYEEFKRYTDYLKKLKEKTDSPGTSLKPSLQHE